MDEKKLYKLKRSLRSKRDAKSRLLLLYGWVKSGDINFQMFTTLTEYLGEPIEDELDWEYTQAKLLKLRKQA